MTHVRGKLLASVAGLVVIGLAAPASADQLLSGAITSASGEKLGGVTVSAKPEGSTITTSVYTDESGDYYFPAAAGRQIPACGRRRSASRPPRATVDLAADASTGSRRSQPMTDPERRFRQLPGEMLVAALPEGHRGGRAHEADLHATTAPAAIPRAIRCSSVRRSRLEQDHRPDEDRANDRRLSGPERQAERHHRVQPEGACRLSRARARPGRNAR